MSKLIERLRDYKVREKPLRDEAATALERAEEALIEYVNASVAVPKDSLSRKHFAHAEAKAREALALLERV